MRLGAVPKPFDDYNGNLGFDPDACRTLATTLSKLLIERSQHAYKVHRALTLERFRARPPPLPGSTSLAKNFSFVQSSHQFTEGFLLISALLKERKAHCLVSRPQAHSLVQSLRSLASTDCVTLYGWQVSERRPVLRVVEVAIPRLLIAKGRMPFHFRRIEHSTSRHVLVTQLVKQTL